MTDPTEAPADVERAFEAYIRGSPWMDVHGAWSQSRAAFRAGFAASAAEREGLLVALRKVFGLINPTQRGSLVLARRIAGEAIGAALSSGQGDGMENC